MWLSLVDRRKIKIFSSHLLPVCARLFKCLDQLDSGKIARVHSILNQKGYMKAKLGVPGWLRGLSIQLLI